MVGDVPSRQALGVQGDDGLVEPAQPAHMPRQDSGLEAARPVPRHVDTDLPDVGAHRLRCRPVPRVAAWSWVAVVVAEVVGQLRGQRGLEDPLGQPAQQPTRPSQRDPVGTGLLDQPDGVLVERPDRSGGDAQAV